MKGPAEVVDVAGSVIPRRGQRYVGGVWQAGLWVREVFDDRRRLRVADPPEGLTQTIPG